MASNNEVMYQFEGGIEPLDLADIDEILGDSQSPAPKNTAQLENANKTYII